ncbi:hypothetical protein SAMN05421856_110129 [Chryseobacterium taichungense]|uniref:Uncharacterized protein n=1 Tax=Chryseobacterium taichungense TaxID=295069 RepID=A0A1H8CWG0_9FLAO|nr:hypothetical protein [Chryseobacterium taichungense]SEM98774.1 hypothetical protein SAMN05421856_110129 [Chryseobacterium taichungense]
MKKILFFLFFSVMFSAQKTEIIKLSKSIKDDNNSIKTFTVIDQRPNKEIGSVMYHKDQVNVVFEHSADKDINDWFYKDNSVRGKDDFVLLLENIEISEDKKEKSSIGKLALKASTFIKKDDGYHFVYRKDTAATVSSRTTPYLAQSLSKKATLILADLIKNSYRKTPWEYGISESELKDYETLLKEKLDILKTDSLKDGIYRSYYSFFTHNPEPGFVIETNKKGVVINAVKGKEKISIRNCYAFVDHGVAYKIIPVGYVEIFRDEMGLFIEVKKEELFPENSSNVFIMGGGVAGLIGSVVGNIAISAIDASAAKKRRAMAGTEVSLDPLTGHYILPEDFGKTK